MWIDVHLPALAGEDLVPVGGQGLVDGTSVREVDPVDQEGVDARGAARQELGKLEVAALLPLVDPR